VATASKIVLHHVGGRWGNQPFPVPSAFESEFVTVLHEADADAIPGIHAARRGDKSELLVVPSCLADTDGEATLNIYLNPGLTSLRKLNASRIDDGYMHILGVDFDRSGALLLEERRIRTQRLDTLLASPETPCPPPDFLSLDVQGCEYEILLGARRTLERNVCGVIAEVIFAEAYQGQKRFQDIFDLLQGLGFEFVRFLSIGNASKPVTPLGFRGTGYQGWADALFLRRPGSISTPPGERRETLSKLCFMAVAFGLIELAVECVEKLGTTPATDDRHSAAYAQFVDALAAVYERDAKLFPPRFSKILPPHRIADFAAGIGPEQWPQLFEGLHAFDDPYRQAVARLLQPGDSEAEALLRRHGFVEQADQVATLRRHQAHGVVQALEQAKRGEQTHG
jgi:FkbM family methyltransferase